jgi:hypothetical protein
MGVTIDGVWTGELSIDHSYTPLSTNNYSAIADLHSLLITTAAAKPLPACCLQQPFPGNGFQQCRFFGFPHSDPLVTASRAELNSSVIWTTAPSLLSRPCRGQLHLGLRTRLLLLSDSCGFVDWGALSVERTGLSFTIAAGPRQSSHSRVEFRGTCDHILLSQMRDFPFRRLLRLEGLWWRYSNPPPHGTELVAPILFFITPRRGQYRKHRSSIVACVFVSAGTCLLSRCSESAVYWRTA